jgi:polysaccharide pyruvyl transferase WcaK-like protein
VLGAFGIKNFGNDATLDALMEAIDAFVEPEEIVCICSVPSYASQRFGVATDYLHGRPRPRDRRMFSSLGMRLLARAPYECARVLSAYRRMRSIDVLVVAGTGALDDQHSRPGGQPLDMAIWCLAGRVAGARVAMLSVGAGPITSRSSRLFLRAAARTAYYLSYRDRMSRSYMQSIGRDVSRDRVAPDLVLGFPSVPRRVRSDGPARSVAIGVLSTLNWRGRPDEYAGYRSRLASVVAGLWQEGNRVTLLIGDRADTESRDQLHITLAGIDEQAARTRLDVPRIDSFDDVLRVMGGCDAAVVSRYHHLVAALLASTPLVSLEYGFKNRALMSDLGLGDCCLTIDDFDPIDVVSRVAALQRRGLPDSVEQALDSYRAQLADQYSAVFGDTERRTSRLEKSEAALGGRAGCAAR